MQPILTPAVDQFIEKTLHEWSSPGLAVALVRKNPDGVWTQIETKGYGIAKADGTKVDEHTLFAIGSNSKLFTAIATGLLISDETLSPRLAWNSKISKILPEWKLQDPIADAETTIIDMLSHRTGLPRHDTVYTLDDTKTTLLEKMKHLRPSAEFREMQQYNNLMYMTASFLPEVLSGVPFPRFVRDKIFNFLGMKSTTYATTSSKLADGFGKDTSTRADDDPFGGTSRAMPYYAPSDGEVNGIQMGPGGVIISAADMAIWLQTLLLEGKHPLTHEQVIPSEVMKKISTGVTVVTLPLLPLRYSEFSPAVYGAGQFVTSYRGHLLIEHGGDNPGFKAAVSRFPNDGLGIAVFSNDGKMGGYVVEIVKYYLTEMALGLELTDWNARMKEEVISQFKSQKEAQSKVNEPKQPPAVPFSQLAQETYQNPAYGTLKFSLATERVEELPNLTESDMPFLWARWEKTWSNHIVLTHFERNVFSVSLPRSLPNNDPSKPYWMYSEFEGSKMTAEFVVRDEAIVGFSMSGNFWGAALDVGKLEGDSTLERAEVWFKKC